MIELRGEVERLNNATNQEVTRRRVEALRLGNMLDALDGQMEGAVGSPELNSALASARAKIAAMKEPAAATASAARRA